MCERCDYAAMMKQTGLRPTQHRLAVLHTVGTASAPLTAQEVFEAVNTNQAINRVTVYRILDTLVSKGLLERISAGDRTFRYGLAPNPHHPHHAHFFCRLCGAMTCLPPDSVPCSWNDGRVAVPGRVEKFEIRIDGICASCLVSQRS